MFGDAFVLLRVDVADPKLRFQRILRRHETRDPEKYEEFLVQDLGEEEVFHVSKTAAMSNYSMKNDGTVDDLHRQIDMLVKSKKLSPG